MRQLVGDKLAVGTVVVAIAATVTLLAGVPTVHAMRGWFWKPFPKALDGGVLLVVGVAVALLGATAHRLRQRAFVASVAGLIGIAVVQQFGLALAEGQGLNALRGRAVYSGHGEYGRVAASGVSVSEVVCDYEQLLARAQLPYCAVKPPGQLLAYVLTDRLSAVATSPGWLERAPMPAVLTDAHRRLVETLTWFWPWLAALGLVPIALLARQLLADAWFWPVLWFALSAPFSLITLHLDQVLFPGLAATLWLAVAAKRHALAGAIAWLATFCSFGLLPAVAFALSLIPLLAPAAERWAQSARAVLRFGLAFAGVGALHCLATGYRPWLRYEQALAAHEQWKHWEPTLRHALAAARMNLVEFAWWANPAMVPPFAVALAAAVRRRGADALDRVVLLAAAALLAVALFGRTWAETARLWLFLLPPVLFCCARPLAARGTAVLTIVAALQWFWVIAIKATQDFR